MTRIRSRALAGAFGLTALLAAGFQPAHAQQPAGPTITTYGFVKAETIYDTRQVADVREGQFHLYPLPENENQDGDDLNATPNLNQTAIQTRLGFRATGAEALGAKVSAVIEGDFFGGPTNDNISLFILRLANVKLDWGTHEVLFGQDWSPEFGTFFPGTVNFNTGAPFQPFSRNPQIRFTLKTEAGFQAEGTFSGQRDAFADIGGPKRQQQSGLPMAHLHLRYNKTGNVAGVGVMMKPLRDALGEDVFFSGAAQAYAKFMQANSFFAAAKLSYGNLVDDLSPGGYVRHIEDGENAYASINTMNVWLDAGTASQNPVQFGFFAGFFSNMGTGTDLVTPDGSGRTRVPNVSSLWRVSPRIVYNAGKFRLAGEVEVTGATYEAGVDEQFKPFTPSGVDPSSVTNVRGLLAAYYFF